jgi:hypothetical protein
MTRPGCLLLLAFLAVAPGCGGNGGPPEAAGPPEDETYIRAARAGQQALELDQPETAARLYARALARARERDDPAAITDAAFGQATAALAHGDARGALEVSRRVREEMARRGRRVTPGLLLAEATANWRLDQMAEADRLAEVVAGRGGEDAEAARRATFLRGLIAAERRDLRRLAAARASLGQPGPAAFRADAAELEALAALLRGDPNTSRQRAIAAAEARREALDYRGLSRALALQGRALSELGDAEGAADLLLRAGRGAAERGEREDARLWLAEAQVLARRRGLGRLEAELRRTQAMLQPGR